MLQAAASETKLRFCGRPVAGSDFLGSLDASSCSLLVRRGRKTAAVAKLALVSSGFVLWISRDLGFVDAHDAYNVRRDPMIAMATVLRPTSTPDDDVSAACRGLWMFSDGMMAGEGRRV